MDKRHPAEVTADRISNAIERYYDDLDGAERDTLSQAKWILIRIAESQQLSMQ